METTIRLARADDAMQVAECVREVYDEYGFTWEPEGYHADLYDLSEYLDEDVARFWVAESGGVVLGCGGIVFHTILSGAPESTTVIDGTVRVAATDGELVRYYVRPSARRRGIASGILTNALIVARDRGCRALEIWSDKRFTEAHQMYQGLGARIVGERICDDPDVSPEWGLYLPVN